MTSTLYLIGTPLGNLKDMTPRATDALRDLDHLFAEDTRELMKLMDALGLSVEGKKLHSYASHNLKRATALALELLESGKSVGFTSDRGMPGISDPGAQLVQGARERNIRVLPIPGPSAVTTLLSVSGFSDSGFLFLGFFPKEIKEQQAVFSMAENLDLPVVFFESPHRVEETLRLLQSRFSEGTVLIGREMTKAFEEYAVFPIREAEQYRGEIRGEFTLAIRIPRKMVSLESMDEVIQDRLVSDKDWSKRMAKKHGFSATELYNALQLARRQ